MSHFGLQVVLVGEQLRHHLLALAACAWLWTGLCLPDPTSMGWTETPNPQEQEVGTSPSSPTSAGLCLTSAPLGSSAQGSGDGRGKKTWRQGQGKKCHSTSWESHRPVQAGPAQTPLAAGTGGCFPAGMGSAPELRSSTSGRWLSRGSAHSPPHPTDRPWVGRAGPQCLERTSAPAPACTRLRLGTGGKSTLGDAGDRTQDLPHAKRALCR